MNKTFLTVICLMFVACVVHAQASLDEIDRRAWHDAVSPLDVESVNMSDIPVRKMKHRASDRCLSLNGSWMLTGADSINSDISVPCNVPGSIHTALKDAGVIPDPCLGRE